MIKNKWFDCFIITILPILATIISLKFHLNFLLTTILIAGIPALWLSYKNPNKIAKVLFFSIIFLVPISIIIDYMGIMDGSWFVSSTVFGFRILQHVPIEDILRSVLGTYSIILFYEHFIGQSHKNLINKNTKFLIGGLIVVFLLFIILYYLNPDILKINYFYAKIGGLFILTPIVISGIKSIKGLKKLRPLVLYFIFVLTMVEVAGISLGHWTFPGQNFVLSILIGGHKVPLEEILLCVIFAPAAMVSYYKLIYNIE